MQRVMLRYKIILSGFILYFLSLMIVMANGNSYAGRFLQAYYLPVANTIGLNTTWNFFSPDPAHVMYIHYLVIFEDTNGRETRPAIDAYYPPSKDAGEFGVTSRRDSYASRFIAIDRDRFGLYFAPWICRKYPEATRVRAELYIKAIPSLDRSHVLKADLLDEMTEPTQYNEMTYECISHEPQTT